MASLIPAHDAPRYITPSNGHAFTLEELQTLVGGDIEALATPWLLRESDGEVRLLMVINEDGLQRHLPLNAFATQIMRAVLRPDEVIVGDVVICTPEEAGEDDDD